ncbi:glycosyltransferase [Marinicrinis lubricantis]|uniref:Glycosyltransferase n=1 Tax=Marinicrinis lubricantis TaxID=2086470 RepID=A0ABW1IQQ4_9BACL
MADTYNVFHSPVEIAGQMGMLVKGLRQYGHKAFGYNTFRTFLNYSDHLQHTDLSNVVGEYHKYKKNIDIFHYHLSATLDSHYADLDEIVKMGKKMIMHHWGNDVRIEAASKILSPFLGDPCNPCTDQLMIEKLKNISSRIKTAIIQDYELHPYVRDYYEHIFILPLAYDAEMVVPSYPDPNKKVPLIIHAPTQPSFKGTAFIEAALTHLKQKGIAFEYKRIEYLSNAEALQLYRQADIVIDQILVGTYGVFSVEAMALGKPVVCYIREDLLNTYPYPLPFIQANPITLADQLERYLTDGELRHTAGRKSREYCLKVHDLNVVIPRLLEIYQFVMNT